MGRLSRLVALAALSVNVCACGDDGDDGADGDGTGGTAGAAAFAGVGGAAPGSSGNGGSSGTRPQETGGNGGAAGTTANGGTSGDTNGGGAGVANGGSGGGAGGGNGGSGGGAGGANGGSGGSAGSASNNDGPRFLRFDLNSTSLTETSGVLVSTLVTDPDGVETVVGGQLYDLTRGVLIGSFYQRSAGTYELVLTWGALHVAQPLRVRAGGEQRTFEALFLDDEGHEARRQFSLDLSCSNATLSGCGVVCVDLNTDTGNCGECGRIAPLPRTCRGGQLECIIQGQSYCAAQNVCADLQSSSEHCGACGASVTAPRVCLRGQPTCPEAGTSYCSTVNECVNLSSSNQHCGACGVPVAPPRVCQSGAPACPDSSTTYCEELNACLDLANDAEHCGACGHACDQPRPDLGQSVCQAGRCEYQCSASAYACDTGCCERFVMSGSSPALAVTGAGTPHIVYLDATGLRHATSAGNGWTAQTLRTGSTSPAAIAADPSGDMHVAFFDAAGWLTFMSQSGTLFGSETVAVGGMGRPALTYAGPNSPVICFAQPNGTTCAVSKLGVWSWSTVSSLTGVPHLARTADGRVHLTATSGIVHYVVYDGQSWSTPVRLHDLNISGSVTSLAAVGNEAWVAHFDNKLVSSINPVDRKRALNSCSSQLLMSARAPHLGFLCGGSAGELVYTPWSGMPAILEPRRITGDRAFAVDGNGAAHIAYEHEGKILYVRHEP